MTLIKPLLAVGFLGIFLVGGVVAQDRRPARPVNEIAQTAPDSPVIKAYQQAHKDMMKGMEMPLTGDADVDFARNMIPHHQTAITMAKIELQHGKDPELKKMAEKMIADQEKETSALKSWLSKHGK